MVGNSFVNYKIKILDVFDGSNGAFSQIVFGTTMFLIMARQGKDKEQCFVSGLRQEGLTIRVRGKPVILEVKLGCLETYHRLTGVFLLHSRCGSGCRAWGSGGLWSRAGGGRGGYSRAQTRYARDDHAGGSWDARSSTEGLAAAIALRTIRQIQVNPTSPIFGKIFIQFIGGWMKLK